MSTTIVYFDKRKLSQHLILFNTLIMNQYYMIYGDSKVKAQILWTKHVNGKIHYLKYNIINVLLSMNYV